MQKIFQAFLFGLFSTSIGCHHLPQRSRDCCSQCECGGQQGAANCLCCCEAELDGVVRTGGQFAHAKALPIRADGLTLFRAIDQTIRDGVRTYRDSVQAASLPQSSSDESVETYYQIAAVLTRKTGESIIFPLWLVDRFQAGDVALRDGDLVELVNYRRTGLMDAEGEALHRTSEQLKSNLVKGNMGSLNEVIDVISVTRLRSSGGVAQFIVPRETAQLFGSEKGFDFAIQNAQIRSTDVVRPTNLDLEGIIREGKRLAIMKSMDSFRAKTCLDELEEENRVLHEKIAKLPLVGPACEFVESTTGLDFRRTIF